MDGSKIVGGGGAGIGLGTLAVYVANRLGANLTSEDGVAIAATAITLGAFLVHNGFKGAFQLIWHGAGNAPPNPAPPGPGLPGA